jgi:hypothetical protein
MVAQRCQIVASYAWGLSHAPWRMLIILQYISPVSAPVGTGRHSR